MALSARRVGWGLAALGAAIGLSGCSYAPQYAATLNHAGHVQIEWCYTSADIVIESSATADVLKLDVPYSSNGDDFVDIESPSSAWTVEGELVLRPDTLLTVWNENDYRRASATTTATTATTTVVSFRVSPAEPELHFQVSALKQGKYFHDGHNISRSEWKDICDPDDGRFGLLVGLVLGLVCVVGVVVVFVMSLVQIVSNRRPTTR